MDILTGLVQVRYWNIIHKPNDSMVIITPYTDMTRNLATFIFAVLFNNGWGAGDKDERKKVRIIQVERKQERITQLVIVSKAAQNDLYYSSIQK